MGIQSYRELTVWQSSMDLAVRCYEVTKTFPREEMFGMTSQIRRAAASVPANIAEGQGRWKTGEFVHFLGIARGSLLEVETHLELCSRVGLLPRPKLEELLRLTDEIGRMLIGLRKSLDSRK